jgi:hypothetical protein
VHNTKDSKSKYRYFTFRLLHGLGY